MSHVVNANKILKSENPQKSSASSILTGKKLKTLQYIKEVIISIVSVNLIRYFEAGEGVAHKLVKEIDYRCIDPPFGSVEKGNEGFSIS